MGKAATKAKNRKEAKKIRKTNKKERQGAKQAKKQAKKEAVKSLAREKVAKKEQDEEKAKVVSKEERIKGYKQKAIEKKIAQKRKHHIEVPEGLSKSAGRRYVEDEKKKRRRDNYDLERIVAGHYSEILNVQKQGWNGEKLVQNILNAIKEQKSTVAIFCQTKAGSRAIQACLKWGSPQQRLELCADLESSIQELLLGKFSHKVATKLFRYVTKRASKRDKVELDKAKREKALKSLLANVKGKWVAKAYFHKHGCACLDAVYHMEAVPKSERRRMFNEVLIPRSLALQVDGYKADMLPQQVFDLDLGKHRAGLLTHWQELCNRAVNKELLSFGSVQLLFQLYTEHCSEEQLKDLLERCIEGAAHLLTTKSGVAALCRLLGVASAKHRKGFCKAVKGQFAAMATNEVDYIVLMRLAATVDDTKMLGQSMVKELIPSLKEICQNSFGKKVALQLMAGLESRYMTQYEKDLVGAVAPTAVKDTTKRREEILEQLLPELKKVLVAAPLEFLADKEGKDVLVSYLIKTKDAEVLKALTDAIAAQKGSGELDNGTVVTACISLLKGDEGDFPIAKAIWAGLAKSVAAAANSRLSFVLLELLRCAATRKDATAALEKVRKALKTDAAGAKLLVEALDTLKKDPSASLAPPKKEGEEKKKVEKKTAAPKTEVTAKVVEEEDEESDDELQGDEFELGDVPEDSDDEEDADEDAEDDDEDDDLEDDEDDEEEEDE